LSIGYHANQVAPLAMDCLHLFDRDLELHVAANSNFEWVAQVSLLRPGCLGLERV